jgi:hypothetical protein
MLNRKNLIAIPGFLVIAVVGSSYFIWKAKREPQLPEQTITGHDSQVSAANPQQQVNFLIGDGDRMMEDGDYVGARSFYERALKLDPSNTAARAGIKSAEDSIKNAKN